MRARTEIQLPGSPHAETTSKDVLSVRSSSVIRQNGDLNFLVGGTVGPVVDPQNADSSILVAVEKPTCRLIRLKRVNDCLFAASGAGGAGSARDLMSRARQGLVDQGEPQKTRRRARTA